MEKKITKRERFETLLTLDAVREIPGMAGFIEHEIDLLARKNSADKKPTTQQIANQAIKQAIYDGMESDTLYTVTDLIKSVDAISDLTNQRVSALLRQMKDDGLVERTEDKRKAYFSKVVAED